SSHCVAIEEVTYWRIAHAFRQVQAKVQISVACDHTAARRAHDVALLDQIGLQNILDGVALFTDGRGQAINANRTAVEFFDQGQQQSSILVIQPALVDVEHVQCKIGDGPGDL